MKRWWSWRGLAHRLARADSAEERARIIGSITFADMLAVDAEFEAWAHDKQLPPGGEGWTTWLMMAGRRVREDQGWRGVDLRACEQPAERAHRAGRAALIEARNIMGEGVSGLLSVARHKRLRVAWEASLGRLMTPTRAKRSCFPATRRMGCAGQSMISPGALQILDAALSAIVEEPPRNDPPASASEGSSYIVGAVPTGAWSGKAGQLATMSAGGWRFLAPVDGLSALVRSDRLRAEYFGGGWEIGTVRAERVEIAGEQVLSTRAGAIASPTGGTTVDAEARGAIDQILAVLRGHGLIAS